MDIIHVAYAFDDNYAEMSCVSMASMLYNTRHPLHFHVLESRLSDESKEKIASLQKRFPHGQWSFHRVDQFNNGLFFTGGHFTVETYYRLLLPELLPRIDKIIYMDGDTVVEGDISTLWRVDLGDKLAGVTPAIRQSNFTKHKDLLGMAENAMYFNAGVLLLDLVNLRQFGLLDKAIEVIPGLHKSFVNNGVDWFVDQEVLNHLLQGKCIFLPPKYNVADHIFDSIDFDDFPLSDWSEAYSHPLIIHYIARDKPTRISKCYMYSPSWERYYAYKAMTPYADILADEHKIGQYHKRESEIENSLIYPAIYFEYKKKKLFTALGENLPTMMSVKKLVLWGVNAYTRHLMAILATKDIYPDLIIDGLPQNRKSNVFHYQVQSPETLLGGSGDYFILLCMVNEKPAEQVGGILVDYGYTKEDYHHIFAPLWAEINEEL